MAIPEWRPRLFLPLLSGSGRLHASICGNKRNKGIIMKSRILRFLIPVFVLCLGLHGQEKNGLRPSADEIIKELQKKHKNLPPEETEFKQTGEERRLMMHRDFLWEMGFSREYLNELYLYELENIEKHIRKARPYLEKNIYGRWVGNEYHARDIVSDFANRGANTPEEFTAFAQLEQLLSEEQNEVAFKMTINHADTGRRVKLYINLGGTNMEHIKFLAQLDKLDNQQ